MSNGNEGNGIVTDEQKVRAVHPDAYKSRESGLYIWASRRQRDQWSRERACFAEDADGFLGYDWSDAASRLQPQSATPAEPVGETISLRPVFVSQGYREAIAANGIEIEGFPAQPQAVKAGDGLVTLADCPVGLFLYGETLALKTEYRTAKGAIEAYIVDSGEFFWGSHPQTVRNQIAQLVKPFDALAQIAALMQQVAELTRERDLWAEQVNDDTTIINTQYAALAAQAAVGESAHPTPAGVPSVLLPATPEEAAEAVDARSELVEALSRFNSKRVRAGYLPVSLSLPSTPAQDGEQTEALYKATAAAERMVKVMLIGRDGVTGLTDEFWKELLILDEILCAALTPPQATPTGESK